jgi:hypothetical protein
MKGGEFIAAGLDAKRFSGPWGYGSFGVFGRRGVSQNLLTSIPTRVYEARAGLEIGFTLDGFLYLNALFTLAARWGQRRPTKLVALPNLWTLAFLPLGVGV